MRKFIAALFLTILMIPGARAQNEPVVRIGLNQNAATVTLRAANAFTVQQTRTQTAKFTMVVALDPNVSGAVTKTSLQYRALVELDGGKLIVLPKAAKVRVDTGGAPIEFENRTYRG